MIRKKWCYCKR